MKIEKWISFEEADRMEQDGARDIGSMGGWFNNGHRWKDYIGRYYDNAPVLPHLEALREEILSRKIRRGGDWHQNSEEGIPLFDDGSVGMFSYRGWGDIMSAVWSEEEDTDYNYMNFYMDCCIPDEKRS